MEKIPTQLSTLWESRFPDLEYPWTHWCIEGDGKYLSTIPADDFKEAIDVVKKNYGKFLEIYAFRARVDNGKTIKHENFLEYHISSMMRDRAKGMFGNNTPNKITSADPSGP
jgi:hypothetical protein